MWYAFHSINLILTTTTSKLYPIQLTQQYLSAGKLIMWSLNYKIHYHLFLEMNITIRLVGQPKALSPEKCQPGTSSWTTQQRSLLKRAKMRCTLTRGGWNIMVYLTDRQIKDLLSFEHNRSSSATPRSIESCTVNTFWIWQLPLKTEIYLALKRSKMRFMLNCDHLSPSRYRLKEHR